MASVALKFTPPDTENLETLRIYEAETQEGPFNVIEEVTPVGSYPDYINNYTTENATSVDYWFAIQWVDDKGAESELSQPIQGGTTTVVGEVTQRVLLRNPNTHEQIAFQEASAVVEELFGTTTPDPGSVTAKQMSGMTLLTLARIQLIPLVTTSNVSQWSAGLVSMKSSDSQQTIKGVQELLKMASGFLGLNIAVVAQMCVPEIAGGLSEIVTADISRLQIEVE